LIKNIPTIEAKMKKYIEDIVRTFLFLLIIYFTISENKDSQRCIDKCRSFCNMCIIGVLNKHTPEWTQCYF
jgi:hypothetical protein